MSGFGGGVGGADYGASQEKGRVMEQVRSQIAVANLQEMIMVREIGGWPGQSLNCDLSPQKMSDKCFRKCVSSPSTSLDNREQVESQNALSRSHILEV